MNRFITTFEMTVDLNYRGCPKTPWFSVFLLRGTLCKKINNWNTEFHRVVHRVSQRKTNIIVAFWTASFLLHALVIPNGT